MVIGLVVIIALIKVASRLVQGRGGRALSATRRRGSVTVVGRQSLGKGVQVAMVSAGEATYLLGVTQRQVTLLGQLDPEVDPASATFPDVAVGELQLVHGDSGVSSPEVEPADVEVTDRADARQDPAPGLRPDPTRAMPALDRHDPTLR